MGSEYRREMLLGFLNEYDKSHNLTFNSITFRPGAKRTTPFGIDVTTPDYVPLRIHLAIDSSYSPRTDYKIFNPFQTEKTEYIDNYGSFGSLLFLYTPFDFHIRIAHMDKSDFASKELFENIISKEPLRVGVLIGNCGNKALSFGKHAHVEIVSNSEEKTILNDILEEKYGKIDSEKNYSDSEINEFSSLAGISDSQGKDLYEAEILKRKIIFVNDRMAKRIDYHTGKVRYFYSSMALFGM